MYGFSEGRLAEAEPHTLLDGGDRHQRQEGAASHAAGAKWRPFGAKCAARTLWRRTVGRRTHGGLAEFVGEPTHQAIAIPLAFDPAPLLQRATASFRLGALVSISMRTSLTFERCGRLFLLPWGSFGLRR